MKAGSIVMSGIALVLCFAGVATAALEITPVDGFEPSGYVGGPFAPSSKDYQLENVGPNSLFWGADIAAAWLDLHPDYWGQLNPNESAIVTVLLTPEADSLPEGVYADTLTFTDITNGGEQTRDVTLTISAAAGVLQVTPLTDFESSGEIGGPFTPPAKDYQLTNLGGSALYWGVDKTADWLDLGPETWGLLGPGESNIVTVSLNAAAETLSEGVHTDTVTFTDITNAEEQTRGVTLTVLLAGGIWVSPTSFDVNVVEGCTLTQNLTIGNNGLEALDFVIRTRVISGSGGSAYHSSSKSAAAKASAGSSLSDHPATPVANAAYKQGELIVRFAPRPDRSQATMQEKQQLLDSLGGGVIAREFVMVPGLTLVRLPAGSTVEGVLEAFNKKDGILYAEPNYELKALSTLPNDPRFDELWGMHNTGQTGGTPDADIDAPEAWDLATGSEEIIVAVIDTGVDYTHPDLAANMWINEDEYYGTPGEDDDGNGYVDDIYGYDFCNYDPDPYDDHYHGTHCAGTIGGIGNNGEGVAGVCWKVKIMALKFLDSGGGGWTDDAIKCVEYSVLMGANLSSNSWGGGGYSQGLEDAIDAAGAAGMLFVAAAGNDSTNTDLDPHYPSSYDCESLISVMATTHSDAKSGFSNWGPVSVDLGAPGSDILSCEPGNRYQYLSGTSMATPHVAGACALLWSMNSMLANSEIKDILLQTVDPTLSGLCVSEGRLNLYNAILETRAPWIRIEPEEGTVGSGDWTDVNVTFDAVEMTPGTYEAEIVIMSNDPCNPAKTVPVTMTVTPDDLVVSPTEDFESSGIKQGPFEPQCRTYTLTNLGEAAVGWGAYWTQDWLAVEPNQGVLEANDSIAVNVCISSYADLLEPNIYTDTVVFQNLDSNSTKPRLATLTVKPPDMFTEVFDEGGDLQLLSVTFSPDGSVSYYEACRERVSEFPTDPNGGTYVSLGDDDFAELILEEGRQVLFYGQWYDRLFVGSNGYITFGQGDTEYVAMLENHFALPRLSAMLTDLTPATAESISYKQLADRIVVTFQGVPLYGDKTAQSSFQIEIFFVDGSIRISWLELAGADCVVGLSEGKGLPPAFFEESDLSGYPPCWPLCDLSRDYSVNFKDFALLAAHWRDADCNIPHWCGRGDFDFSGDVNSIDLGIFVQDWLTEMEMWWLWPVSHWNFDEGQGSIAYDSAGDNDGTIYGAQWTSGRIDGALSFDGVDDYVNIGQPASLSYMGKGTIVLWFNPEIPIDDTLDTYLSLFEKNRDGGAYNGDIWLAFSAQSSRQGRLQLDITNDTGGRFIVYSDSNFWPAGVWQHVAVTWENATGAVRMFINGVEQTDRIDNFAGVTMSAARDVTIGSNSEKTMYWWEGIIDDVRVYHRALSSTEVYEIYYEGLGAKAYNPDPAEGAVNVDPNVVLSWTLGKDAISHDVYFGSDFNDVNDANTVSAAYMGNYGINSWDPCGLELETTYYWRIDELGGEETCKGDMWSFTTWPSEPDPNLLGWWRFDEGEGNTAYDSAGNNHGAIYAAQWTSGQVDGALSFDGAEDYVNIGQPASLSYMGKGTIVLWFNPEIPIDDTLDTYLSLFEKNRDGGAYNGDMFLTFSRRSGYQGRLSIDITNNTGGHFIVYSDSNFWPAGAWQHVAVTWDNATGAIRMFINGVEQSDKTDDFAGVTMSAARDVTIGGNSEKTMYWWEGIIDDVRIYDRALSAAEIEQLYQSYWE